MKITCMACGHQAESKTNNVGDAMAETGYKPLLGADGSMRWLCGFDQEMVGRAVQTVIYLLGGNGNDRLHYLHWPSLMSLIDKEPK